MARPELSIEIDRLFTPDGREVVTGEEIDQRREKLPAVAKALDRKEVEELLGEGVDAVLLKVTRRQPVRIT